ncbi:MAG: trehalase family glycosidase [Bacteroidota bacterium]|nr:trehalase family glycosidase [Bacteroidota bacterium]
MSIPKHVRSIICGAFLCSPLLGAAQVISGSEGTRIGNFDYGSAASITFIKDDLAAFVMTPSINPNPGMAAPDNSIHKFIDKGIRFDWGRVKDAVVGRLISDHPVKVTFKLSSGWPGLFSQFSELPVQNKGVKGEARLADGKKITWQVRTSPAPVFIETTERVTRDGKSLNIGGSQFVVSVTPEVPVYFVAGFGELPDFDGIDKTLNKAEQVYEAERPKAMGTAGDFIGAIADNLNNSRIYSNDNHMVAISVSRGWIRGPNANPYFCWDSFFNGLLASLDDPQMGRETVRAILSCQTEEGLVPNFGHWVSGGQTISTDRSQPPVGSLCVWKMHLLQPDVAFLQEVYPKLAKWHAWWMVARNAKHDGLLEWGSSMGNINLAKYETGWDDTPQFEGTKMVGKTMNAYAIDLNSLWAMDAHYLALIANAIGHVADAKKYQQEEKEMIQRINVKLWNEDLGIYCSRLWDSDDGKPGAFLTRITPMNFYPLICGAPDTQRAKRVLSVMTDPKQFWGEWILPTVSRTDPLFPQQGYWHGTIWGPVNYLVFQGVKCYATPQVQADYAEKSVKLFMKNWETDGVCGENYLSTTGEQHTKLARSDSHYTWGALLCIIGLESTVNLSDDGQAIAGTGFNQDIEMNNIPWGGRLHHIKVRDRKVKILEKP